MSAYVVDTHSLIWHLQRSSKLSVQARALFQDADKGQAVIWIPGIVLVEMVYLAEKQRIDVGLVRSTLSLLRDNPANYFIAPLDINLVEAMIQVPRALVPDMPDRIIVATALYLGLPLISRDTAFAQVPGLQAVW